MIWKPLSRSLPILLGLSIPLFSAGCTTSSARYADLKARAAVASLTDQALSISDQERQIGRQIAENPEICSQVQRSGVALGERQDTALLKTDAALGRANAIIRACALYNQVYRDGIAGKRVVAND